MDERVYEMLSGIHRLKEKCHTYRHVALEKNSEMDRGKAIAYIRMEGELDKLLDIFKPEEKKFDRED